MDSSTHDMTRSEVPAKASFVTLPGEIHDMVCSFLTNTNTLRDVRDTCTTLREKTEEIYHKRTYSTLEINFTVEHLAYVLKVSMHKRYSPLVQKILIRPAFLNRTNCRDGDDSRLLVEALQNFKNLQSIAILPFETGKDVRLRVRANARVPMVGDESYDPTVVTRHDPSLVHDPISHAFFVVREALQDSSSVVHLQAGAIPSPSGERNSVDHAVMQSNTADTCLAQLESFHLVASAHGGSLGIEVNLANLLRPMQKLKSLRLQFWGYNVEWLSKTFELITLPNLKELSIQAVRKVKATALGDFVQRHKNTLESLELSIITFEDDVLATTFPAIFQNLHLHKLKLSQLCSARHGLLLLGTTCEIICDVCHGDLDAAWTFKRGPHCDHASINITSGEVEVSHELVRRFEIVDLLPWPLRPPPPSFMSDTDETDADEASLSDFEDGDMEEGVMEDVVTENQAAPLISSAPTPAIANPSNTSGLANFLPLRSVAGPAVPATEPNRWWAPLHIQKRLRRGSDPAPSRAPVSTDAFNLTRDSNGNDGTFNGYEEYRREVKAKGKSTLFLPLTSRRRSAVPPAKEFEDVEDMMGDEDEEESVDVSTTLGRLERKREESSEWSAQRGRASKSRKLLRELLG